MTLTQALQTAAASLAGGRFSAAESICRQILGLDPDQPDALHILGMTAGRMGNHKAAEELIRQSLVSRQNWAEGHFNLAFALEQCGRFDDAVTAYQRAADLRPVFFEAWCNLGNLLQRMNRSADAATAYTRAVSIRPDVAEAQCNLAAMLNKSQRFGEAIPAARAAAAMRPGYAKAFNNLGVALAGTGQVDLAIEAYQRVVELDPASAEAFTNLGSGFLSRGEVTEAIRAYRQASVIDPSDAAAESAVVFTMHSSPDFNAADIAAAAAQWEKHHGAPLQQSWRQHVNDRDPARRLRVGYVSADFRNHPVGRFIAPLLAEHDRDRFEIFAYSQVRSPDDLTARMRGQVNHWRNIAGLSHTAAAELIRGDAIDILVDLGMHTADNRLPVFARKPAPVQVSWLAYPGTTGLGAIDYRLTDPYLDPPGYAKTHCSEKTIVLPDTFGCYSPPDDLDVPIHPLPAASVGHVTFGSLNTVRKVNDPLLAVWASVMHEVPGSRLILRTESETYTRKTAERLSDLGINPDRLEFIGSLSRSAYLHLHHRIDIGLDTFPYSGHTTTCDALWMGVPVVSLTGTTGVGRGGLSILSNVGLAELATDSIQQYIRTAAALSNDLSQLKELRSGLREMMRRSALMNAPRFARQIESAFRTMWLKNTWGARSFTNHPGQRA